MQYICFLYFHNTTLNAKNSAQLIGELSVFVKLLVAFFICKIDALYCFQLSP